MGVTIGAFVILAIFIPKPIGVGVQLFRTFSVDTRIQNTIEGVQLWTKNQFLVSDTIGFDMKKPN